ncbi:MAG: type II toxin-antitoxin system RelE/ParE family toxin [Limisphaerales bacterium]
MMPLEKSWRAEEDLSDIFAWIAQDNIEIAEDFLEIVENTFQFIARNPGIGRERFYYAVGLRSWRIPNFENYLIFYRPQYEVLQIIRVLHGARDLEKEFKSEL